MKCDVLVVGAGPGGSSTAYWLACAGLDVLLCDKSHFPRDKPCGDGLTPRAVTELERLGLGQFACTHGHPFDAVRVTKMDAASEPYFLRSNRADDARKGLVIQRRVLDDALRCHSIAAGARFLPGFAAAKLDRSNGSDHDHSGIAGSGKVDVIGRYRGSEQIVQTRLVVIATGASRTFAHQAGLTNGRTPQAVALRGYVSGLHNITNTIEVLLDQDMLPGYSWIFPVTDCLANVGVGIVSTDPQHRSQQIRQAFANLMHHPYLAHCRLSGAPQGFPIRTDFPNVVTHADNVLMVGEAAGLVDPMTGEGIAFALESGRLAAETAITSLAANDVGASQLATYSSALRHHYADYFRDSHELLARLNHPKVFRAIDQAGHYDSRIGNAFRIALLDEQPRRGIRVLCDVLQDARHDAHQGGQRTALAQTLFHLNAYQPLLDQCREYVVAQVSEDAPDPTIVELVRRGKMLRALLVFIGCQAAGKDAHCVLEGAGGIELVHAASLIHDDVMDGSTMRRGLRAIHQTLGSARAVVCGDYLIAKAFRLLAASQRTNPAANVVQAFIVGAQSGIQACRGQFRDVGIWNAQNLSAANYYQVATDKTASVISGALCAGAVLAGADSSLVNTLDHYGRCVGLAFQIRDDLLDFMDAATLSSIDRKPSLPIALAFERSDADQRKLILQFLNDGVVSANALHQLISETEGLKDAEEAASYWSAQAVQAATMIPHVNETLTTFAHYAVLREE